MPAQLLGLTDTIDMLQELGVGELDWGVPGWLATATGVLRAHPDIAAACGRRRERFPERSVYNLLCDIEWNTPVGEARACGGDVMMRVSSPVTRS